MSYSFSRVLNMTSGLIKLGTLNQCLPKSLGINVGTAVQGLPRILNVTAPLRNSIVLQNAGIRNYKCSSINYQESSKPEKEGAPELTLSDLCISRLREIIDPNDGSFLRVVIEGGGCSGFQYKFDIDSTMNEDDRVFEKDGVKVVVDETSLEYVKGSTIDYHVELIRSAFRIINNPLAETGCSCGSSFSIKI